MKQIKISQAWIKNSTLRKVEIYIYTNLAEPPAEAGKLYSVGRAQQSPSLYAFIMTAPYLAAHTATVSQETENRTVINRLVSFWLKYTTSATYFLLIFDPELKLIIGFICLAS